jgi:hypothetical protein
LPAFYCLSINLQIAEYCINAKVTGVLRHTHYLKNWAAHPDVIFTSYLAAVRRILLKLILHP